MSAADLHSPLAPANLSLGRKGTNPDAAVWKDAYNEEYDGIHGLNTFTEINEEDYQELVREHGVDAEAIPTMNIFTIKKDKNGNPVGAKSSRIVVLGNLEKRVWEKGDRYARYLTPH